MNIWILSDNIPGHVNQARGLVSCIELLQPVTVTEISAILVRPWLRRALASALNRDWTGAGQLVESSYNCSSLPATAPDLIVSAGGNTSFLNIALARRYQCANFFLGSLRQLDASGFTAVLTLDPVAAVDNIVMPVLPTLINTQALREAAGQAQFDREHPIFALMIGGHGSGYRYGSADWLHLARGVNTAFVETDARWVISTSRRTGKAAEQEIRAHLDTDAIADAVWFADQPDNRTLQYLACADRVYCTEDSLTMLYECIAAAGKVIALAPDAADPPLRYAAKINRLANGGRLLRCNITDFAKSLQINTLKPGAEAAVPSDWRQELARLVEPFLPMTSGAETASRSATSS